MLSYSYKDEFKRLMKKPEDIEFETSLIKNNLQFERIIEAYFMREKLKEYRKLAASRDIEERAKVAKNPAKLKSELVKFYSDPATSKDKQAYIDEIELIT